ncbi:EamA family transporter RarD [Yinghuangia aomiensis]|uniref:EamA family transporter RarD n=1 Tax=Yinghuangia aomiensis TaxID=676205 RepID=A0ABP9H4J9_9ACTN
MGRLRGLLLGLGAYVLWGLFPLYWPLLKPAGAVELLAHRTVWSMAVVIGLLAVERRWAWVREVIRARAALGRCVLAAATLTFNWGLYIYSVNTGRVVEAALGYFIAPLVLIAVGVLKFRERLGPLQWTAVALGAGAVLVLSSASGRAPVTALALAGSWAVYGYLKKTVALPATQSLAIETAAMFLPAVGYLAWLAASGRGSFEIAAPGHSLLLATTGLAVVPLLLFAAAARKVTMSTLGALQYVEPTLQFGIGVLIRHETMPVGRWTGFILVWAALLLLAFDAGTSPGTT